MHQIHHVFIEDAQGLGDPALHQYPKAAGGQVLMQAGQRLVGPLMVGFANQGDGFERRIHSQSDLGWVLRASIQCFAPLVTLSRVTGVAIPLRLLVKR